MSFNIESLGRWLIILGGSLTVIGIIIWVIGRFTGWEKFPGTIRFQSGNLACVIPILGSIILSILLTILLNILSRYIK
jgi:hypothetical protein